MEREMSATCMDKAGEDVVLSKDAFEFIKILAGQTQMKMKIEDIRNAYLQFKENIERLSVYPSFHRGLKLNDYATVLHKVVSLFSFSNGMIGELQKEIFQYLLQKYPKLITGNRAASVNFSGQTPLHMAICKKSPDVVRSLIQAKKRSKGGLGKLYSMKATGREFRNTVMMGELPLSIAALSGDTKIMTILLEDNINICEENSQHDNLCHSLLKYAHIYPEKEDDALAMITFVSEKAKLFMDEKGKKSIMKLFSMMNINQETPLALSAKFGLVEIFKYIMEQAYCKLDNEKSEGLFDVQLYDMTEIDDQLKILTRQKEETKKDTEANDKNVPSSNVRSEPSIFDFLFDLPYTSALKFMEIRPIKWMIARKWRYYRWYLYVWWFIHTVIMTILTASAVARVTSAEEAVTINKGLGGPFPAISSAIFLSVALFYVWMGGFFTVIIQVCRGNFRQSYKPFLNPYANASFKVLFSLFALCLILDFLLTWVEAYEHYLLLAAIVIGWYISLFFMRAHRFFCFFTSLIQRTLVHDLVQFAPIIFIQLLAYSTAMFMLLQGANNDGQEDYSSWWKMLLVTFQSFLGLAEIPLLTAKQTVLISIVYVIFITMTAILMLNALIAILSSTCNDLITHFTKEMHLNLQRLSIIIFFEELLPSCITCEIAAKVTKQINVLGYDRKLDKCFPMDRYMIRIDTLNDENDNEKVPTVRKLLENIMHARSVADNSNRNWTTESKYIIDDNLSSTKSTSVDGTIKTTNSAPSRSVLEIYNYNLPQD